MTTYPIVIKLVDNYGTANTYFIEINAKGAFLVSGSDTPNAFSNVFLTDAAAVRFSLARCKTPNAALQIVRDYVGKFLSGPNQGKPTYTATIFD